MELTRRQEALRDKVIAAETEATDVRRELVKAEADVEQVRQRMARDQGRLDAGQSGHKELESLQHELVTLAQRKSTLEDIELDVMERLETATAAVDQLHAEQDQVATQMAAATTRREKVFAESMTERAGLLQTRTTLTESTDGALLALYEKIREGNDGIGVALLRARRCEGCHLEINPQDLQRMRVAADDEVLRCEECRRILIRSAESGL